MKNRSSDRKERSKEREYGGRQTKEERKSELQ